MNKKIGVSVFLCFFGIMSFAETIQNSKYVNVDYSEPVYKTIKIVKPYKECFEVIEKESYECGDNSNVNKNSIGIDTLIGGVAGVILGNQIGKGNGKIAAKVIGGIGGAGIANSMRGNSETCYRDKVVEKCNSKEKYEEENRLIGYNNFATYENYKIKKFNESKLDRIKIDLRINY